MSETNDASHVRALRGATTVSADDAEEITERLGVLLKKMLLDNEVEKDDLISVIFTATQDIKSIFPATAARGFGFGDVPLLSTQELAVEGSAPRCLRVLMLFETTKSRDSLRHVYLEGAQGLRDDLP